MLSPTGLLDQLSRQLAGLGFVDLVPNDLAAEEVDDQVEVCLLYTSDAADDLSV